jgi:hypothetical protein
MTMATVQMTLGELTRALERCNQDSSTQYDFVYFRPTREVGSWRGVYAQLAIGYTNENQPPVKVGELVALLKEADGKTFTGYKGGEFTMGRDTLMWVANYREAGDTGIVGIRDEGYRVIIETGFCEVQ